MDIGKADIESLVPKLIQLAKDNRYTKIFAKVPESKADRFLTAGFLIEATAEQLFRGEKRVCSLASFLINREEKNNYIGSIRTYYQLLGQNEPRGRFFP